MINTYLGYQLLTRDMSASIRRVEQQPLVQRETEYYLENIGKVSSIDEFLADDRLYRYAMKAHGLEDMTYAKAFMRKALTEGLSEPDSFANKLTDKRYADFVRSFNFAALGENATTYNAAQQGTTSKYAMQAELAGVSPEHEAVKRDTAYYLENIVKVRTIDAFLDNDRLYDYAMRAHGFVTADEDKDFMRRVLEGGIRDPDSFANTLEDKRYAAFAASFNFEALGENATTAVSAQGPAVDKFLRQSLEEDAGRQNEGVRLALYFERKAGSIASFYDVLADPALAKVVRTVLGLPDSFATADIDRQVAMMENRLDIEDFKEPEAFAKFLTRFTSMWELNNPSTTRQTSLGLLFGQPVELGISTDVLLTLQRMRS